MRPQLLVVSLLALCRMPAGRACLQCDRKTRLLHEDFLLSAASVEKQIALTMIRDHAYVTYRQTSQAHRGVIDPTTFYRVSTEYHSEFNRIKKTLQPGLCPNKCGQLYQRVIDCSSCKYKLYIVLLPQTSWTVASTTLPGPPGPPGSTQLEESDFQTLVVTEEPSVVLNQLHAKEQGTYRCSLQDRKATVFSTVTFFLTVTALPTQTPIQLITLPTLPPRYTSSTLPLTRYQLLSIIATVTALSLVASIGLTVALGLTMKRKMKELRARRMVGPPRQADSEPTGAERKTPSYDQEGPVELLPFLFLGSALHSSRREALVAAGITAVLNVSSTCPSLYEGELRYLRLNVEDSLLTDIRACFSQAIAFIGEQLGSAPSGSGAYLLSEACEDFY
ncbi:unnamed protein product [Gadus morhua 'NCC']